MNQLNPIVFLIFLIQYSLFVKSQSCEELEEVVGDIKIKWPYSASSAQVLSDPPCLNPSNVLVKRTCSNGHWLPKNHECVSVERFTPQCKDNDMLFENYCFYIRHNQKWTLETPVVDIELLTDPKTFQIFNKFKQYYQISISEIWLPVKRSEKFGKFVWKIPKNYLQRFIYYSSRNTYMLEYVLRDCMSLNLTSQEPTYNPEDCNKKHTIVHIYKPESRYFVNTATLYYSTSNNNVYYIEKNCTILAEPKTEEDNFVIKKLVKSKKKLSCRIGIEKDHNNTFIWKNNRKHINYTDWIYATNFNYSVVVVSADGWKLENNSTEISCSVCQIDHTNYQTELKFGLNANKTQLILTAYSYQTVSLIAASTIGLEDINLDPQFRKISVQNDVSNVANNWEKLDSRSIWKVNFKYATSNYYSLSALTLPHKREIETAKVFFNNELGRQYAFKIKIYEICKNMYCDPHIIYDGGNNYKRISDYLFSQIKVMQQSIKENLNGHYFNITRIRAVKILEIDLSGSVEILLHLHSYSTNKNITAEYYYVQKLLKILHDNSLDVFVFNYFISAEAQLNMKRYKIHIKYKTVKYSMACINEETLDENNNKIHWKFTEIGDNHNKMNCSRLQNDETYNSYYTRKCTGDHLNGANWEEPTKHYSHPSMYSENTGKLCNLFKETNLNTNQVINQLTNITTNNRNIKATDVYYITKIVRNVTTTKQLKQVNEVGKKSLAKDASLLISNLLTIDKKFLEEANENSNSINNFLALIEKLLPELTKHDLDNRGVKEIVYDNFMYSILNPIVSNISGIALFRPNASNGNNSPFTKYNIKYLQANTSINEIVAWENLETAIYVPQLLLNHIKNTAKNNVRISISVFFNDSLFIESKSVDKKSKLLTKVFNVVIHGYENYLDSPFPIISRLENSVSSEQPCGFWDFGTQEENKPRWIKEINKDTFLYRNTQLQVCFFKHLTNFAMLLGNVISTNENKNLDIITMVGSSLSGIGICGVFLTAVIFKSWRQRIGTKIVLNVSACILLQIISLYSNMKHSDLACVVTGSLLHYSVLCGFSWSLIMAVLQYIRFVQVFKNQTPHLLLKASIVGWILPIIPVSIAVVYNYMTEGQYMANLQQSGTNVICYPQGMMLYLTLLLPVCSIVTTNLIIFVIIFFKITYRPKISNNLKEDKVFMQQIQLAIFLFFLLGLTWISGLITIIYHSDVFLYIFSATASTQGFILFLFYVLLDHGTRGLWNKKINKAQSSKTSYQSNSQQVSQPVSNTFIASKEESGGSKSKGVADQRLLIQAVMQELNDTHRSRKK